MKQTGNHKVIPVDKMAESHVSVPISIKGDNLNSSTIENAPLISSGAMVLEDYLGSTKGASAVVEIKVDMNDAVPLCRGNTNMTKMVDGSIMTTLVDDVITNTGTDILSPLPR